MVVLKNGPLMPIPSIQPGETLKANMSAQFEEPAMDIGKNLEHS
jgi:hypothetical protein